MTNLKHIGLKLLLGVLVILITNTQIFPWYYANGSEDAFIPPPDSSNEGTSPSTIEADIVRGAGYFLQAYANILQFMNHVELSTLKGMDYQQPQSLLDSALTQMIQANATFTHLIHTAGYTPYNPYTIETLKKFNYEEFCLTHRMNKEIFAEVQSYLGSGSVTEMYGKIISDTENIIKLIILVKEKIDNGIFPSPFHVRQLNQTFSLSLLFGQYVADVFACIDSGIEEPSF
jgi:hypothetical protein